MPHIGYGDAIVCLPIFKSYAEKGIKTTVILPGHTLSLLTALYKNPNLNFIPLELAFKETIAEGRSLPTQARIYGKKLGIPVLYLGYELLTVHSIVRPDLDFNSVFYKIARVPLRLKNEVTYSNILRADPSQYPVPQKPYALVDHFPGSIREIPAAVLEDIRSRGLELINNPRDVPYLKLSALIENARELHFVNSSLFCLTLFLNPRAQSKNIYLMRHGVYHGLGFYDLTWNEWVLNNDEGVQLPSPERVDVLSLMNQRRDLANDWWRRMLDKLLFGTNIEDTLI
jgi:hypothetical protein